MNDWIFLFLICLFTLFLLFNFLSWLLVALFLDSVSKFIWKLAGAFYLVSISICLWVQKAFILFLDIAFYFWWWLLSVYWRIAILSLNWDICLIIIICAWIWVANYGIIIIDGWLCMASINTCWRNAAHNRGLLLWRRKGFVRRSFGFLVDTAHLIIEKYAYKLFDS